MRTIIELPHDQLAHLDAHCRLESISRAEAIRRAVAAMLAERSSADAADAFGLWRDRADQALADQERLRNEWT
ncbi:MAG: ribbon-helix-helix protein, CopG family [Acidobacteria bacterium]|jgi:metal-responsive CopG/Arc/MetJ family transcriptional regulator|nr:ribbon-helix-helix protein, CopG family [Acidobacteriota bacterium]